MRNASIGAVVAVFIAVVFVAIFLPPAPSGTRAPLTSSESTVSLLFTSAVAPDGLQLKMTLNATAMSSDGAIAGQVQVVNTSGQNVTVSTLERSQNITSWSNSIHVCPTDYFMGYSVFAGHFTRGNISSAGNALSLVPPMNDQCSVPVGAGSITFLPQLGNTADRAVDPGYPQSVVPDQLNMTTLFCNTTQSTKETFGCAWAMPGLAGYWDQNYRFPNGTGANFGFSSPAFSHFHPGEYTVVAWDEWDQYAYATFVVSRG